MPTSPIAGISVGADKRLKLLSVTDNITGGQYKLKYYGDDENMNLPNRMSNSYDYWGVYNGKDNNTSIATTIYRKGRYDFSTDRRLFVGADKLPDFEFGKIANLKEIIYPTGGSTKITYEADEFIKDPTIDSNYLPNYKYDKKEIGASSSLSTTMTPFTIETDSYEFLYHYYSEDHPKVYPPEAHIRDCSLKLFKMPNEANPVIDLPTYFPENMASNIFNRLTPGNYKLYLTSGYDTVHDETVGCTFQADWYEQISEGDPDIKKAGTIRIKKIEQIDNGNSNIIREYSYGTTTESGNYLGTSGINIGEQYFTSIASSRFPRNINGGYTERTILTNNPGWNVSTVAGKAIGYTHVQEKYKNTLNNESYKKEYTFYNEDNHSGNLEPYSFIKRSYPQKNFKRGYLLSEKNYNSDNELVKTVENEEPSLDPYFNYVSTAIPEYGSNLLLRGLEIYHKTTSCVGPSCTYGFDYEPFNINNYWVKDTKSTITDYFSNGTTLVTEKTIDYSTATNRHTFPIGQTTTIIGGNQTITQSYLYSIEKGNTYLEGKNMIGIPLVTETKKNGKTISKTESVYPNSEQQAKERIINNVDNKDYPLPRNVLSYNLDNLNISDLEVNYDYYDSKGNLLQYTAKSGVTTAIVWGYNQTQPIAKIEGAMYSQVGSLVSAIINASNDDAVDTAIGNPKEQDLLNALDAFRNNTTLSGYQITTYTYDSLVGVRSITPPSGVRQVYIYDTANRLKEVREHDQTGNLLKEYQYNYKN